MILPPERLQCLRLSRLTAQTIPTITSTLIIYDIPSNIDVDKGTYKYDSATGLITFLKTGYYHATHMCSWAASAVGNRSQVIYITDIAVNAPRDSILATNPDIISTRVFEYTFRIMNLGASLSFKLIQTSGGNLNLNGGVNTLAASIVRLSSL